MSYVIWIYVSLGHPQQSEWVRMDESFLTPAICADEGKRLHQTYRCVPADYDGPEYGVWLK
jgi:hypothetical protein